MSVFAAAWRRQWSRAAARAELLNRYWAEVGEPGKAYSAALHAERCRQICERYGC